MAKTIFVDLTRCTGCRGCQVACKQWKNVPGEATKNWGSHQNPPDLSYQSIRIVRFTEAMLPDKEGKDKLAWLFFPEQCRHCYSAPCKRKADQYDSGAILHDQDTGAVVFTDKIRKVPGDLLRAACPYDIPRAAPDGHGASKCDFCFDRLQNGMLPACVLSCPTRCLEFGEEKDMQALAAQRLKKVKKEFPTAYLGDPLNARVLYLYQTDHRLYYQDSAVANPDNAITTGPRRVDGF